MLQWPKNINAAFAAYTMLIGMLNRIKAYDKKACKTRNMSRIVKKESGRLTIKGMKNTMSKLQHGGDDQRRSASGAPERETILVHQITALG